MREIIPVPVCLACGNPMELVKKGNRYFYSCHSCDFGNSFQTIKAMVCPDCFSQLTIVQQEYWRITLCTNLSCTSYRLGERGKGVFRSIRNVNFRNFLDWNTMKNYFLFRSVVPIKYHNHLVEFTNKIIEAQGWDWEERPEMR